MPTDGGAKPTYCRVAQSPVSPSQQPTLNLQRGHWKLPWRHSIAAPQRRQISTWASACAMLIASRYVRGRTDTIRRDWRRGRVVRQRPAKPRTAVRVRSAPLGVSLSDIGGRPCSFRGRRKHSGVRRQMLEVPGSSGQSPEEVAAGPHDRGGHPVRIFALRDQLKRSFTVHSSTACGMEPAPGGLGLCVNRMPHDPHCCQRRSLPVGEITVADLRLDEHAIANDEIGKRRRALTASLRIRGGCDRGRRRTRDVRTPPRLGRLPLRVRRPPVPGAWSQLAYERCS